MVASAFANRVYVNTATVGQGTVTLGTAKSAAFLTSAEGLTGGATYSYVIEEGTDFEIGTGVYTASGTTLTRATVLKSKIGGVAGTTKMTLAGAATVRITALAEDFSSILTSIAGIAVPLGIQLLSDTAVTSYTPTSGTKRVLVIAVGGGGAGGGVDSSGAGAGFAAFGGTGAPGEVRLGVFDIHAAGSPITIQVGAGGAPGSAGANAGGDGTDTIFGSFMTAGHGAGGAGKVSSGRGSGANGATSAGSGGVVIRNANANQSQQPSTTTTGFLAPATPALFGSTRITFANVTTDNTSFSGVSGAASGYGMAGGGAVTVGTAATNRAGGSGAQGALLIVEFG